MSNSGSDTRQPRCCGELVDWIDEDDHPIAAVTRREMRSSNLLHRVTSTFVFHPNGRVFLQQRTLSKDVYPGFYDPLVGGTVTSGESFLNNARREVEEELGLKAEALFCLFQHRFRDSSTNSLIRVFACIHRESVRLQEEEVQWGDWAEWNQIEGLIRAGAVCPDSAAGCHIFSSRYGRSNNFAHVIAPRLSPDL